MIWTVHQADVSTFLKDQPPATFDGCLTDPPYGLKFMGKAWDHGVPSSEVWAEVLRVLKPGAFCLAFGGTRTFHRLAVAIEDAGFEIRDCALWLYGSGFPKSHNFGRTIEGFDGYGTALKPAWEPCIVAMKPCDGTFAENALKHGVAGLNIEAGRVGKEFIPAQIRGFSRIGTFEGADGNITPEHSGRWPANLILDADAGMRLDASASTEQPSRFFYAAKASRAERDAGLEGFEKVRRTDGREKDIENPRLRTTPWANHHPCLKPLDLNRYLASLILPPNRDTPRRLLVPFAGSGSEMIGGLMAGWDEAVGIELEPEYCEIARARLRFYGDAGFTVPIF